MYKERAMWRVYTCGRHRDSVTNWEEERKTLTIGLTEEEKKSKYAKYFYIPLDMPTEENLLAYERGHQLPEEQAFLPDDYGRLMMSDEKFKMVSGYRMIEDGTAYSLMRVDQPGVTHDAMKAFVEHYKPEGDLFYKTWCPGFHMRHYDALAVEDLGNGMEYINFTQYFNPQTFGVTEEQMNTSRDCIGIEGANVELSPYHDYGNNIRYAMETCFYRDTEDGQETWIHVWHGIHMIDGKAVRMIPEGESVNVAEVRAQMQHLVMEYTHLSKLIPRFYHDWLEEQEK